MTDTRNKNVRWNTGELGTMQWSGIHAAILMDIRDELQSINSTLKCHNTLAIPRYLRRIAGNTAKPGKKKRRKSRRRNK